MTDRAQTYLRTILHAPRERADGYNYLAWIQGGRVGSPPPLAEGLSQLVRLNLDRIMSGDPRRFPAMAAQLPSPSGAQLP